MQKYSFDSIAGYETEKKELKSLCRLLNNRDKYIQKGDKLPKGIIFYGETGTGKTLFSKVLADECGLPFINIDLTDAVTAKEVCTRIKNAFQTATESGKYTVIFLDEMDKILPDSSRDYVSDQSKRVLTQLLTLIDGINSGENIFFAATCNDYEDMPQSLVRAGRIDKKIYLGLPNFKSRVSILDLYIGKTQCKFEFDSERMAALCANFSCAEVETFVNECVISSDDDNFVSREIIYKKLNEISSDNVCEEKEYKNTRLQAVHSAGHFIVAQALHPSTYVLSCGSKFLGNDFFKALSVGDYDDYDGDDDYDYDDEDDDEDEEDVRIKNLKEKDFSCNDFMDYIAVAAGGYVAERLFFNTSYDCYNDFYEMDWAVYQMSSLGMLGYEYYYDKNKDYTQEFIAKFYEKRVELVNSGIARAEKILSENRELAEYLVSLLLKNLTIPQAELEPVIKVFLEEHK